MMIVCIWDCITFQGVPYLDVRIKWPNDLYLDGLKVGGILCTSTYRSKKFNVSAGKFLSIKVCKHRQTNVPILRWIRLATVSKRGNL